MMRYVSKLLGRGGVYLYSNKRSCSLDASQPREPVENMLEFNGDKISKEDVPQSAYLLHLELEFLSNKNQIGPQFWNKKFGEDKLVVYTDGSLYRNRAGIGLFVEPGHPFNTSAMVPGEYSKSALPEIFAVLVALEQLQNWKPLQGKQLVIRTDYLEIIRLMKCAGKRRRNVFSSEYIHMHELASTFPTGVVFQHIYSHSIDEHHGNDIVDYFARSAIGAPLRNKKEDVLKVTKLTLPNTHSAFVPGKEGTSCHRRMPGSKESTKTQISGDLHTDTVDAATRKVLHLVEKSVIDNEIYGWNYVTNGDLAYFDCVKTTVYKVALVPVKGNIFAPHVQFGFVVATVTELSLYALIEVTDENGTSISIDPNNRFAIPLEMLAVNDVTGTDDGRIFFCADESLYEFVYEHQTRWFGIAGGGPTCKIAKLSGSLWSSLIPFAASNTEEIEQLSIDQSRHLLYCLGKHGSIQVFDLGTDGKQCRRSCGLVSGQISNQANLLTQCGHEEGAFSHIVSICALNATASNQLNLVAVTAKGIRIYFSVLDRPLKKVTDGYSGSKISHVLQDEVRANKLPVSHVRFSSGIVPASIYGNGPNGVSIGHADNRICVMATLNREIISVMSDLYFPHTVTLKETKTSLEVPGNVWAIKPRINCMPPNLPPDLVPRCLPHLFFRLPIVNSSNLLVCSNEGIYEFAQTTPVDRLFRALLDGGIDGRETAEVLRDFGHTETLVLALHILVSPLTKEEGVKDRAASLFYSLKYSARLESADKSTHDIWKTENSVADWKNRMRSPLQASTPRFENYSSPKFSSPFSAGDMSMEVVSGNMRLMTSHRHDALFLYFSRLVAPVWTSSLCKYTNKTLSSLFTIDEMEKLANDLRQLAVAMERYRLLPSTDAPFANRLPTKIQNEASSIEKQSLQALNYIVQISAETLSLWCIACSLNLDAIAAGIEHNTLTQMADRKFYQLVGENDPLSSDLIRSLIRYFLGDEAGTKTISDRLRRECPTLYSADDACVTNAMEQLRLAASVAPGPSRRSLVAAAVDMFAQSIQKVSLDVVGRELLSLQGGDYIVDLCLLRAKRDDPKQLALVAYQQGLSSADDRAMSIAIEKRMIAYKTLTDILDILEGNTRGSSLEEKEHAVYRDQIIDRVIASDDELAHVTIFRWMMDRSKSGSILQTKSRYLASFLTREISTANGQRYLDLLWRWYEKSGNYEKAVTLLSRLAYSDSSDMSLDQRYAYLSHAIICANSSSDTVTRYTVQELRDKLEVAHIQMTIRSTLEKSGTMTNRHRDALRILDIPILTSIQLQSTIKKVWENIIQTELSGDGNGEERVRSVLREMHSAFTKTLYFPTEYLIRKLLVKGASGTIRISPMFFAHLPSDIDITFHSLSDIILNEYRMGDPFWTQDHNCQEYIITIGLSVAEQLLDTHTKISNRTQSIASCDALLSAFLLDCKVVSASNILRQLAPRIQHTQLQVVALNNRD